METRHGSIGLGTPLTQQGVARMESRGVRDKIQMSQETANILIASRKSDWMTPQEERVVVKGKESFKLSGCMRIQIG